MVVSRLEASVEELVAKANRGESPALGDTNFPFGFPTCLKELAEEGNKTLFQRLVDSYVSYIHRANHSSLTPDQVRLDALDFIEFQCMVADTGRMTIGVPADYKTNGPARRTFLEIYSGQLARDKEYTPTHSIKL